MTRMTYAGSLVDVSFGGAVCRHAAECVLGMPTVFNPAGRPWIDLTQADSEASARPCWT